MRVCANATTNFITGLKARLADAATGTLIEDSRPVGEMVGNCTNVFVNTTAGEYIRNITAEYTSTSLYRLTFVTSKGTKTTVGRQYAGTKAKFFIFDDAEARFVGFNGTHTTRVNSISPQTYNSTCLAEAFANATETTEVEPAVTDSIDTVVSDNTTTDANATMAENITDSTNSTVDDNWMVEHLKALAEDEMAHKQREKRLLIIIICSIGGFLILIVAVALLQMCFIRAKNRKA